MIKRNPLFFLILFANLFFITGCSNKPEEQFRRPSIVVTNTYLESALKDVGEGYVDITCIAPPGMCPGHFDITPETAQVISEADVLLRFDFQQEMDKQIGSVNGDIRVIPIKVGWGMCVPDTYFDVCGQISSRLEDTLDGYTGVFETELEPIARRLEKLERNVRTGIEQAGLRLLPVIASTHQGRFCRFMDLDVVEMFGSIEQEVPRRIQECISAGRDKEVKLIIANRPEGTQLAESIAEQIGAEVLVFENFPDTPSGENFDAMLEKNVNKLIIAAGSI